jgi:CRP-like cAMP-binding protein
MDDQADALYFIQSGRIALPEVKAYLAEGSVFGEIGIFAEDHRRTSSAVCETPVRLFRVSAERVWDLYAENPSFAVHLLRLAASRIMGERLRFRLPPL